MVLGCYPIVTLTDRERVLELKHQLKQEKTPCKAKRAARQQKVRDATTFADVVQQCASAKSKEGEKIADRVALLKRHASALMPLPISSVDTKIIAKARQCQHSANSAPYAERRRQDPALCQGPRTALDG